MNNLGKSAELTPSQKAWWVWWAVPFPINFLKLIYGLVAFYLFCWFGFFSVLKGYALLKLALLHLQWWLVLAWPLLCITEAALFILPIQFTWLLWWMPPEWFSSSPMRWAFKQIAVFFAAATILFWISGILVGYVADLDPDAAWRVGVTGSRPPSHLRP